MAIHKKESFTAEDQELAEFANALSHPARIAILKVLAEHHECICGKIVDLLPLAQSTVSQHLKELKKAGLIQGTIDGPRSCYCIDPIAFGKLSRTFHGLLDNRAVNSAEDCC